MVSVSENLISTKYSNQQNMWFNVEAGMLTSVGQLLVMLGELNRKLN